MRAEARRGLASLTTSGERFFRRGDVLVRHNALGTGWSAWRKALVMLGLVILVAGCTMGSNPTGVTQQKVPTGGQGRLRIATTTSTADSGLLDAILPDFEARTGIKAEYIAVGTGQALKLGEQGDVDVVLVHAPEKEEQFVAQGHGVNRKHVMYNDFVILGPENDPALIRGMDDAAVAFARIAVAGAKFVSRGDQSGTHTKELAIWEKARVQPAEPWYISAGQGMGAVLTIANEQLAYTLSDRGTYLSRRADLDLVILVEGDPILFNPYSVIAVNPERHPGVNFEAAMRFIRWLTSVETQKLIGEFGREQYGQPLFTPDSDEWRAAQS
jgi:tungstate transport system substrate-binding protein